MPPKRASSNKKLKSDELKRVHEFTVDGVVVATSSKNDSKKLKTASKRNASFNKKIQITVTIRPFFTHPPS